VTALSADKALSREVFNDNTFTLASGQTVWKGALIAIKLGTGTVVEATGASDEVVIGTAMERVDASAAAKPIAVCLEREFSVLYCANGSSIAATDLGATVYIADDQTVSLSPSSSGASVAGTVWKVDSVRGVAVELRRPSAGSGSGLTETASGAFVSNDLVLGDNPSSGAVYDIPLTGAASTVTLPAAAREGSSIYFVADGTKNGHTVTYRDATGPASLTTALTASKRHQVQAIFLNGKWTANAYVSP
jgi:hypothetical protein